MFITVDGFKDANFGLVLHEGHEQHIHHRHDAAVRVEGLIAPSEPLIVRVGNEQGLSRLGHVGDVTLAGSLCHFDVNGGVLAATGDQAQRAAVEEPKVDSLAGEHGNRLGRNLSDDLIELKSRVQRLLEVVELRHAVDGVEQFLALGVGILRGQDSRSGKADDRGKFFDDFWFKGSGKSEDLNGADQLVFQDQGDVSHGFNGTGKIEVSEVFTAHLRAWVNDGLGLIREEGSNQGAGIGD